MKGKLFASSQNFLAVSLHYREQCWQMFNIYAPNSRSGRRLLWEEISNIILTNQKDQFMLAGDFNSPLYPSEKCGGLEDFSNSMGDLASFINATSLMDIDLQSAPFTWSNNRKGRHLIQVRLDRFLISTNWDIENSSYLKTLPRIAFDHNPLLLHWKDRPY